jgi:hypothetical protein
MNVHWCVLSGGGCSGGGVSNVVSATTYDVCPGCAGLMADPAQRACGTDVANFDLVTMHPAVPDLVQNRFGVALVRGAETGIHQGGGSRRCRRGWDASCAQSCDGELDVSNGFGECGVGGNQVFDGGILLNDCVCQIVEGRSHLLCLVESSGLICTKCCVAGSHVIDITHLSKGGSPMGLPVGPGVVNNWMILPLVPGQRHVAACQGVLGTCGNHGFVKDGDTGIGGKDLTFLLLPCVDGKGEARVIPEWKLVMLSSRSGWLIWA